MYRSQYIRAMRYVDIDHSVIDIEEMYDYRSQCCGRQTASAVIRLTIYVQLS